jgi:hypothetical protein
MRVAKLCRHVALGHLLLSCEFKKFNSLDQKLLAKAPKKLNPKYLENEDSNYSIFFILR